MRLFIAEKPDLAKAIMSGMEGEKHSMGGYYVKGNDIITYAFGHLLELCEPQDYDAKYKDWIFADLPFNIDKFKYKPKADKGAKDQLSLICSLIEDSRVKEIVNCGDADEEGQILIDEILNHAKNKKPVSRLVLQDLTVKGVKKALGAIKSNDDFKGISESGFARSQADWLVGLNLTRAFTLQARNKGAKGVLSVGRVQTPILALVVTRDLEHEGHEASYYYTINADFRTHDDLINLNLKTKEPITQNAEAEKIVAFCKDKEGFLDVKHTNESTKQPLPFNLLDLQAAAATKFKFNPDKTLKITQSLREEHKLISYNRSDCSYLPENLHSEAPDILKAIAATVSDFANFSKDADPSIKSHAFNDKFITAHYGIIPTSVSVDESKLSADELKIYKLIALNFLAQFYPQKTFKKTVVSVNLGEYEFSTSSSKTTNKGWELLFSDAEEEKEDIFVLDNLESGNSTCISVQSEKKKTKPKPYYTMATLLKDLASVSKYVEDETIKALLKAKDRGKKGENGGIGTPATRSEHIKNLLKREYIVIKDKNVLSTPKGREFINKLPNSLTKPEITAMWWQAGQDILEGNLSREVFLKTVLDFIKDQLEDLKKDGFEIKAASMLDKSYPCECGGFLQRRKSKEGKFFWGCSEWKNGCKNTMSDKAGKPVKSNFNFKKRRKK